MYLFHQVCSEIFSSFFYFEVENTRKTKKTKNDDSLVFSSSISLTLINQKLMLKYYCCPKNNNNILKYTFLSDKILFFWFIISNLFKKFKFKNISGFFLIFVQNSRYFLPKLSNSMVFQVLAPCSKKKKILNDRTVNNEKYNICHYFIKRTVNTNPSFFNKS